MHEVFLEWRLSDTLQIKRLENEMNVPNTILSFIEIVSYPSSSACV
jgi:hypothetical protein